MRISGRTKAGWHQRLSVSDPLNDGLTGGVARAGDVVVARHRLHGPVAQVALDCLYSVVCLERWRYSIDQHDCFAGSVSQPTGPHAQPTRNKLELPFISIICRHLHKRTYAYLRGPRARPRRPRPRSSSRSVPPRWAPSSAGRWRLARGVV